MIVWQSLRACYLAVALCMGIERELPPMPRVVVVPGARFACGEVCDDPPVCAQRRVGYCVGEYRRGRVYVAEGGIATVPHEMIHHLLARRGLPDDGSHEGWPWTLGCDRRETVPACAGFWGWR